MESAMLSALKFDLTVAYPLRFIERNMRLVDSDSTFNNLCNYLCELTLQKITFLNFLPSMVTFINCLERLWVYCELSRLLPLQHPWLFPCSIWPLGGIHNTFHTVSSWDTLLSELLANETGYCVEELYDCKFAILKLLLDPTYGFQLDLHCTS